ncbi:pseudouridine synthase [Cryptobacterium curtum]
MSSTDRKDISFRPDGDSRCDKRTDAGEMLPATPEKSKTPETPEISGVSPAIQTQEAPFTSEEVYAWQERLAHHDFPLRLQKFLARAGVASRRGSERLISAGRVAVNGIVITELGTKVDPLVDEVCVDGAIVTWGAPAVTLALNKPAGIITTMKDLRGRRCVADIMPTEQYPGLFPIGRLDQDTTGLLLFSTDGNLGNALLHPSHGVSKVYRATIEGSIGQAALEQLASGILLDDGMTAPARVSVVQAGKKHSVIELELHEGRKHQVKRMCQAVGHPVVKLHRASFGPIDLAGLATGAYRRLEGAELSVLYNAAGLCCPDDEEC